MAIKLFALTDLTDVLKAAVESKDINATIDDVEISEKASKSGKGGKKGYVRLEALTGKGMQMLCGGKLVPSTARPKEGKDERTDDEKRPGACDYFNYGYDLDIRASVRADLAGELEGPEKVLAKACKGLIDSGIFTRDQAIDVVLSKAKAEGKEVVSVEQLTRALAA